MKIQCALVVGTTAPDPALDLADTVDLFGRAERMVKEALVEGEAWPPVPEGKRRPGAGQPCMEASFLRFIASPGGVHEVIDSEISDQRPAVSVACGFVRSARQAHRKPLVVFVNAPAEERFVHSLLPWLAQARTPDALPIVRRNDDPNWADVLLSSNGSLAEVAALHWVPPWADPDVGIDVMGLACRDWLPSMGELCHD